VVLFPSLGGMASIVVGGGGSITGHEDILDRMKHARNKIYNPIDRQPKEYRIAAGL
jgi:hypothetical protein